MRGVDSSLLDEWQRMMHPELALTEPDAVPDSEPAAHDITRDTRVFTTLVRNLAFSLVRSLADRDYESFLDAVEPGNTEFSTLDVERAFRPLFETGASIELGADARSPKNTTLTVEDGHWDLTQLLLVAGEVSEYTVRGPHRSRPALAPNAGR